jgi:class 3 adenylate cyclase
MPLESLLLGRLRRGEYYLFGERSELYRLLGSPLPAFPPGEASEDGLERLHIRFDPELRETFHRHLGRMVHAVAGGRGGPADSVNDETGEYGQVLAETLRHILLADRRLGLSNLFWVAHSLQVAEVMKAYFMETGEKPALKYQIHPLLSGLYKRLEKKALESLSRPEARVVEFRRGAGRNNGLAKAVMEDQLPLTEVDLRTFDAQGVLISENRRFRIGSGAYEELGRIFEGRLETGIRREQKQWLELLESVAPSVSPGTMLNEGRLVRYAVQRPVVESLLHDIDEVVVPVTRNRILKKERDRLGGWGELFSAYLDLADCLLRTQALCAVRRCLVPAEKGFDDRETREKFAEGSLYQISRRADVVSNVRKVSILFADLRDFLKTSERAISESDLTVELYRIFDPAAIVVSTFGGKIEKYLGDGFMATFGVSRRSRTDNLSALRAAVAMQHMLLKLRKQKKTDFRMGISLHTGRVAVARFLLDGERDETTPIGRQVNIAGRLSSSKGTVVTAGGAPPGEGRAGAGGKKAEEEGAGVVMLDAGGNLLNDGIAVSGSFLQELKKSADLESFHEGGRRGYLFRDRQTSLAMRFEYVGEAGFKGLEGKISIFSLTAEKVKKG